MKAFMASAGSLLSNVRAIGDLKPPKRRHMLDAGWPGLCPKLILPSFPVNEIAKYVDSDWGRPTK
jgi:hypothetical protein